jgi:hypothetical protein
MLDLLQIKQLRPPLKGSGPVGDPTVANYDEAKAHPMAALPDPLVLNDGKRVTTAKMWWNVRRPQIVEMFDREVYGRTPKNLPKVRWEVTATTPSTMDGVAVVTKSVTGHVDNSRYPLLTVDVKLEVTTPAEAKGPVPVMMELGTIQAAAVGSAAPAWHQQVLAKGWGYAVLDFASVQKDSGDAMTEGIIGLMNHGQPRGLEDWGALKAWAWGLSRALDYFEQDKSVDAKRVGIEGHSRFGKAALVAMAYDQRFAIAYISSSGEGGAKLLRRNFGEPVENLASVREYFWMDGNFLKYAGPLEPKDLPVDAHELIALCAPRPVFLGGGVTNGDGWADTQGMFDAEVAAGPVYRLLGKKDLGAATLPAVETPLLSGDLGFRQHGGGHTPAPNWAAFLEFAQRHFR